MPHREAAQPSKLCQERADPFPAVPDRDGVQGQQKSGHVLILAIKVRQGNLQGGSQQLDGAQRGFVYAMFVSADAGAGAGFIQTNGHPDLFLSKTQGLAALAYSVTDD